MALSMVTNVKLSVFQSLKTIGGGHSIWVSIHWIPAIFLRVRNSTEFVILMFIILIWGRYLKGEVI